MADKGSRDPRTFEIIGAAMEVHKELGSGFLEGVYHEALMIEFSAREVPFLHEVDLPIYYKGQPLKTIYRADFICYDEVIVEIKTVDTLTKIHSSQLIHYLKTTKMKTGLLINFAKESLDYKRFVNTKG